MSDEPYPPEWEAAFTAFERQHVPHEPSEACARVHCYSHGVDEPDEPCFRYCYECSHVFPTEQALIDDDSAVWAEVGTPRVRSADEIFCCPHCAHDF